MNAAAFSGSAKAWLCCAQRRGDDVDYLYGRPPPITRHLAALGCTLGFVPHIAASIAGLAALIHTSALAFQVVKYLGVVYLLYMVWTVLREGGAMHISGRRASVSSISIVTHGFLLNILNPKLSLFFLAFLPQFVPAETLNPSYHMLKLALVFILLTFVAFVGYGTFASAARSYVVSKPRVML